MAFPNPAGGTSGILSGAVPPLANHPESSENRGDIQAATEGRRLSIPQVIAPGFSWSWYGCETRDRPRSTAGGSFCEARTFCQAMEGVLARRGITASGAQREKGFGSVWEFFCQRCKHCRNVTDMVCCVGSEAHESR